MREPSSAELRRSQRIPTTVPIRLAVEAEGFRVEREASTVDLSLRGIRVRTPLALLPGDTVGVIPKRDFQHAIPARVIWAQLAGADMWSLAGLEFLETLPA